MSTPFNGLHIMTDDSAIPLCIGSANNIIDLPESKIEQVIDEDQNNAYTRIIWNLKRKLLQMRNVEKENASLKAEIAALKAAAYLRSKN